MKENYDAGDGTKLFEQVYEPNSGFIEVIVKRHHMGEALRLYNVLHAELAKIMNEDLLELSLLQPNKALIMAATTKWWTPNKLASQIIETNPTLVHSSIQQKKKRTSNEQYSYSNQSTYSAITSNSTVQTPTSYPSIITQQQKSTNSNSNHSNKHSPSYSDNNSTATMTSITSNSESAIWSAIYKIQNDQTTLHNKIDTVSMNTEKAIIQTTTEVVNQATKELEQKMNINFQQIQEAQKTSEMRMQTHLEYVTNIQLKVNHTQEAQNSSINNSLEILMKGMNSLTSAFHDNKSSSKRKMDTTIQNNTPIISEIESEEMAQDIHKISSIPNGNNSESYGSQHKTVANES